MELSKIPVEVRLALPQAVGKIRFLNYKDLKTIHLEDLDNPNTEIKRYSLP